MLEVLVFEDARLTGDVFLVLRLTQRVGVRLPVAPDVLPDLVAILLPEASFDDLDWSPPQVPVELDTRPGDFVVRWCLPTGSA